METVGFYSSSNDQKIFPGKSQFAKSQKKKDMNYQSFISRQSSDNFYQAPLLQTAGGGGLILQRRPRPHHHFHSYPPFSLPQPQQQQQQQQQQQKQPPLLPLPLPHTRIRNPDPHPPRVIRSLSCQPTNRKNRNDSLTTPRKYSKQQPLPTIAKILKPTAKDIEDQVRKMYNSSISGSSCTGTDSDIKLPMIDAKVVNDFSGSVAPFRLSPPPSSLPLPTFSLRPKHMRSCNVEASGFDAGATDKLQRLLRLN